MNSAAAAIDSVLNSDAAAIDSVLNSAAAAIDSVLTDSNDLSTNLQTYREKEKIPNPTDEFYKKT